MRSSIVTVRFLLLAGCCLIALPAHAQGHRAWTWDASVFAGYKLSGHDLQLGDAANRSESPDNSANYGLRVGLYVTEAISAEVEGAYTSTKWRSDAKAVSVLGMRGSALYSFLDGPFRPFLRAGIGNESLMNTKIGVRADTDMATVWGIGAKYELTPTLGLRADVLLVNTAGAHNLSEQNYEFLFGVSGAVGRAEPPAPPPPPAPVALPAPPPDTDGDGIIDDLDKCPNEAEDKDGFEDHDGCPEVDNDGDGILDVADKCPNEGEDRDGFQDEDGCPDRDNDGDGIYDGADRCPNDAESKNDYQDRDGCPDQVPDEIAQFVQGPIEAMDFDAGKSVLRKAAQKVLDKLFAVLDQYKDARIAVSVHVEDKGDAEKDQALSDERATSIKNYLIEKGLTEDRIKATGHGATQPLGDTKDAKAQAKNRRVEFKLM